ncbi:hypothetical protein SeMB42_g05001 [Synchytrium endobioticum]|uniref:Uncharacterized protein n=1 Tax=Synchytrium endobioticum TaxID=286115 RepID=A0A507CUB1_9FUNG|nr:hypothetical protein SeMB42_g05001 [Synchytrium endobioticum]
MPPTLVTGSTSSSSSRVVIWLIEHQRFARKMSSGPSIVLYSASTIMNVPLGYIRQRRTQRFTWQWLLAIHASVPMLVLLRRHYKLPGNTIPTSVVVAIASQLAGGGIASYHKQNDDRRSI